MSTGLITHNKVNVIYADYRDKTQVEMDEMLQETERSILQFINDGDSFLLLSDLRGVKITVSFLKRIIKVGKGVIPYVDRTAVLGISGYKVFLFKIYRLVTGSKMTPFETEKEALDYLVGVK